MGRRWGRERYKRGVREGCTEGVRGTHRTLVHGPKITTGVRGVFVLSTRFLLVMNSGKYWIWLEMVTHYI